MAGIPKVPRGHIRAPCEIILFWRVEAMKICDDDGVSVKKEEEQQE